MSENNEEQLNDVTHASAALEVGHRLRHAREAKGLELAEVARELRLNEKLIAALEAGHSDELPPATFVSGYLRSYGRLLGMDTDALVRDYHGGEESPAPLAPNAGTAEVRSSDAPVKAITYLIILALAVLLVLWWLARQPEEGVPAAEPEIESLAAGDSLELNLPPMVYSEPEPAAEAMDETDAPVEAAAPVAESEPASVAEDATPLIAVSVVEDSWIEIYDSDGAQLVYGLYKKGRDLRVDEGMAPFKLFFGYAAGVTLTYKGERVDVMRHKRSNNDTARFQLGSAEDNDR